MQLITCIPSKSKIITEIIFMFVLGYMVEAPGLVPCRIALFSASSAAGR